MMQPLQSAKLLHASSRSQWRAWLKKNYKSKTEIWLVYYKKHTSKLRISYNDAVEEALCFGWIDSTVRTIDEDSFAQKFSVRRPRSKYSQANLERLRALAKQGKVAKDVLESLPDLSREALAIPADILKAIKARKEAWKNFQRFSQSYVRIRIAYIEAARKRPAEFEKRLSHFVRMTEANKQFGFGGIEKYY
jgi:uncharacterized protein YdeI (YjbR/CyaY-like superfamily)